MRLAFPKTSPQRLNMLAAPRPALAPTPVATTSAGLDERVVMLVMGLAIAACAALIAGGHGLIATVEGEPGRVATLLTLTVALQMFSVQVFGRGSVSVSGIGILASAFLFDTGTTMAIAVLAAVAQWIRTRRELYKAAFDAVNLAVAAGAASLAFQALDDWRVLAAIVAGLIFATINNGLLCLAMSFAERAP